MEKIEEINIEFEIECLLGEGPIWEDDLQRLLWVDILNGCVHAYNPLTKIHKSYNFPLQIGAIAKRGAGKYLAATDQGFVELDFERLEFIKLIDPESHLPDNRFNDGKMDRLGRFWAGTMDDKLGSLGAGKLYLLDADNRIEIKIDQVTCSNGLVWSHDNKIFYFIDTPTHQVLAYDYEEKSGTICNPRVIITFPKSEGLPDGMTIDQDGMLWIAIWGGWKVSRWNPLSGERLQDIHLPVSQVTSCTFGGINNQDLFVTSARVGLSQNDLQSQPLAGSVFRVKNPLRLS